MAIKTSPLKKVHISNPFSYIFSKIKAMFHQGELTMEEMEQLAARFTKEAKEATLNKQANQALAYNHLMNINR